ncbi:cysteine--tRNA ligase [Filifactor alocis]|uniref:cysteine--tRNA ligase n=1 Tax=Filifactor alocis TaxID=143361 RepID=UPI0028D08EAC|nr:cysteine--tRNA ligase [Filifactor alocis]
MRFYNTLTRRKDEFVPIEKNKVKMYSCGPTVYNYFHIGNARPFIIFDTLRNYLEYRGYEVTFVQNFTDVDDKIINRANEEGILPLEVADKYIKEYFVDADGLGIRRASVHPRVTECIEDIIEFIEELIQKGHAYEIDGDVYYDTKSFDGYGKLSRQNMEELNAGARIDVDDRKKSPSDFALWKKKKEGEIGWISPWGEGRPGWHIECSVMSRKYLGDTIDIHSGGQDLIFPHHENEIAQSEGRSGKEFAHYWLHNGYININNQKMSKSLNNFFTVREISEVIDLEIVRFFLLSAQYRNPVNFSQDLLDAAKSGMERLYNTKHKVEFLLEQAQGMIKEDEKEFVSKLPSYRELFIEAMDDDLNTADGISAIFELSKFINTTVSEKSSKEYLQECMNIFCELTNVLNIIQKKKSDGFDEDKINELIEQRSLAKKEKNFAEADRIRGQLHDMGVEVLDTRQGTTWKKID